MFNCFMQGLLKEQERIGGSRRASILAEGQGASFGGSAKESLPSASKNAFEQDVLSKRYWCQSIKSNRNFSLVPSFKQKDR